MALTVKLESFEGPMDLLFHLIEKNKIDIYDIPISELTEQYIEYIDEFDSRDMENISEFLVMAATLIEIKSKMLLPKEVNEDNEEVDPREELVNRLIEYKKFKMLADKFDDRQKNTGFCYYKPPDNEIIKRVRAEVPKEISDILDGADLNMLYGAFEEVLRRQEVKIDKIRSKFNSVTRESFTIEEKIEHINNVLRLKGSIGFMAMFKDTTSKAEIVATFLAMLELIKIKKIYIVQNKIFDEIMIKKYEDVE